MPGLQLRDQFSLAWHGLLDLVYPPHCLVCERAARPFLCEACAGAFVPIQEPTCARCGRPRRDGDDPPCSLCADNDGPWHFDAARAAAIYQGPMRQAIHRLKYGRADVLAEPLGVFLANRCLLDDLLPTTDFDIVIPVPIHAARRRRRGFNQAEVLAGPVAAAFGIPLLPDAVERVRKTPPQVGLSPDARRANLTAAFRVADRSKVDGKRVLLIDDVFTTGTTVDACAGILKAGGGAAQVTVVTLAAGG